MLVSLGGAEVRVCREDKCGLQRMTEVLASSEAIT